MITSIKPINHCFNFALLELQNTMIKHLNIKVEGEVQGVWFRKFATEEAQRLVIKGFVCNRSDGSVYIEAEGSEEQLKQLVQWCHKGPEKAVVVSVQVSEGELNHFDEFNTTYC